MFSVSNGRTVLERGYAEPPLRIGRCLEHDGSLQLIVASSAPGVFGGDCLEQRVDVGCGARVRLTSQSALQVHPSVVGGPARLRSRYRVEPGGCLSCAWEPVIPFPGASLDQQMEIDVAKGGRLTWSDALMAGREARGERWVFEAIEHQLTVRYDERLAYRERYRVSGGAQAADRWAAGDCSYFGTVVRVGCGDDRARADAVHAELQGIDGISGAAELMSDSDLLIVRIAAGAGVPFHRARAAVERAFAADQNR